MWTRQYCWIDCVWLSANVIWIRDLSQFIGRLSWWTRSWLKKLFMVLLSIMKWISVFLIFAGRNRSSAELADLASSEAWYRTLGSGFRLDSGSGSGLDSGSGSGSGLGLDWIIWIFNFDWSWSRRSWSLTNFLIFCSSVCVGRFFTFGAGAFFRSGSDLHGASSGVFGIVRSGWHIKSPEAFNAPESLTSSCYVQDRHWSYDQVHGNKNIVFYQNRFSCDLLSTLSVKIS